MPWGAKPSDGVYWDFSGRTKSKTYFSGFETRSKVRKADVECVLLRKTWLTLNFLLIWLANAKTQIDNSMITRIKKVTQLAQVLSNTKKTISRANFFD
jgi:hypothetical protein